MLRFIRRAQSCISSMPDQCLLPMTTPGVWLASLGLHIQLKILYFYLYFYHLHVLCLHSTAMSTSHIPRIDHSKYPTYPSAAIHMAKDTSYSPGSIAASRWFHGHELSRFTHLHMPELMLCVYRETSTIFEIP